MLHVAALCQYHNNIKINQRGYVRLASELSMEESPVLDRIVIRWRLFLTSTSCITRLYSLRAAREVREESSLNSDKNYKKT